MTLVNPDAMHMLPKKSLALVTPRLFKYSSPFVAQPITKIVQYALVKRTKSGKQLSKKIIFWPTKSFVSLLALF